MHDHSSSSQPTPSQTGVVAQVNYATKTAVILVPEDVSHFNDHQMAEYLDSLTAARAMWEGKGFKVQYRPRSET